MDQVKEIAEYVSTSHIKPSLNKSLTASSVPQEFVKDGLQFVNRCTKPDKREFIKISQAVGVGFVIMGVIGYVVKLVHIPVNNILVGGS